MSDGLSILAGHVGSKRDQIPSSGMRLHHTNLQERLARFLRATVIGPDGFAEQRKTGDITAWKGAGRQGNDYFVMGQGLASLEPG